MRRIQMTISQDGTEIFQDVFDCVDLGDLPDAVSEGIRVFQRATPALAKQTPLGTLSINLQEVGGKPQGA